MLSLLHSFDVFILEFVNLSYHNFILNNFFLLISNLGIIYFWIIISILLYVFGKDKEKRVAKRMILVLIVTSIVIHLLKYIIMRPRPYEELSSLVLLGLGTDPSFPSGHTATATSMCYVLSKYYDNIYIMLIPVLVAFSRLYIGVHYPSDVLGGFLIGFSLAYILVNYLNFKHFEI